MSCFVPVALAHASRLINHGPTVLVTTAHNGRRNIMAAAWSMPVEFTPPRIAIVIDKRTLTKEMIAASGVFAVCIPGVAQAKLTYAVGTCSGRDVDKFAHYAIDAATGPVTGVPVLELGCSAWMECRLIPEAHTEQAYDTCFAEVVSAAADPCIFCEGHWNVDERNGDLHTIHHVGAGKFVSGGGMFGVGANNV
ncbi:flavin reductase family protein [Burkholderiaceae bacterium DAT-1]|nr:flavin reductase family protein [Burkholderiaceae bacterium DAT-1]